MYCCFVKDWTDIKGDDDAYKAILQAYQHIESSTQSGQNAFQEFLQQVFSGDGILQLVPHSAIPLLRQYSMTDNPPDPRLTPLIPALGMIFRTGNPANQPLPPELRVLCGTLADRAETVFNTLVNRGTIIKETAAPPPTSIGRSWEETGCYYGRAPIRYRPLYEGLDSDVTFDGAQDSESCRKFYSTYSKRTLTGGLMALWCTHLICVGFHMIARAEGRNDVFSPLLLYWEKAPQTVIYDFACQLAPYSMVREPEFFKDTLFVIDKMHATGHTACSSASFLTNYVKTRPELGNVNSSAAECCNSGLSKIKKSISYMGERRTFVYAFVFLNVWNRMRELNRQKLREREYNRLQQAVAMVWGIQFFKQHFKI